MKNPIKFFTNKYYRNAEMVSYWKTSESVEAKQMRQPDGSYVMQMQGEKYLFPGYPRGVLLFSGLSKLKHEIKNQLFNDSWALLEEGKSSREVVKNIKSVILPSIYKIAEATKYDMVPYELLNPPIKELWRAMTAIENGNLHVRMLKQIICFILQEDDAYRMRFQWIIKFFPRWWKPSIKQFEFGLKMLEQGEIVGDMKERQRLFHRIIMTMLEDPAIRKYFDAFLKEVDWNKLRLTKADKYFFRAKYFKVDYPEYAY